MDNISLLREKFAIHDVNLDSESVVALGNRLPIIVKGRKSPLIIRGHSMHMTLRYGAELLKHLSFISHAETVETLVDWQGLWDKLITPFEKDNVSNTWIAVYFEGKVLFQSGYHHTFFDIIEQTEFKYINSSQGYDQSIVMAQNAFKQMGRSVMIEQESHVGFVLDETKDENRFAIILRTPEQKATFIVRMSINEKHKLHPHDYICMHLGADYIEGINMAVRSGFMEKDIARGNIKQYSDGMKFYKKIQKRMQSLSVNISQAESKYDLKYRPEKPDLKLIQKECLES